MQTQQAKLVHSLPIVEFVKILDVALSISSSQSLFGIQVFSKTLVESANLYVCAVRPGFHFMLYVS